jgi:pimeloyl-ACP methyl ester carboxylesterase
LNRFKVTRRDALTFGLAGAATSLVAQQTAEMSKARQDAPITFVICHGGWSAGWAWKKMRPLLHKPPASILFTPTYTGVGERAHLATPEVGLETHIRDILAVIETEELSDVTLIGHSYGGTVATSVAERARDRIRRLIYLDAFIGVNGQSQYELIGKTVAPDTPWQVPPIPIPSDTSETDRKWMTAHRSLQPIASFTTQSRLSGGDMPPRAYIRCKRLAPGDPVRGSAQKAQESGWPYVEIDASHNAHITAPDLLASTLDKLVRLT